MFGMKPYHSIEIDRADDIDVVQNEWLLQATGIKKEMSGLLQAATSVKQDILARDFDMHAKIVIGLQVLDHLLREVMCIDDYLVHAEGAQAREGDLQHRAAGDFYKRLGAVVA